MKSKKFWSYEVCSQFNLTEEILSTSKKRNKFYEDALYFYEMMGTGPHPSIKHLQGNANPTSINFNNVLVDINTIKIFFHLLPTSKITTLKLNNNNFTLKCLESLVKNLTEKENNINNISYEWNSEIIIDDIKYSYKDISIIEDEKLLQDIKKSQDLIVNLATHVPSKLEILCLRGDFLGDEAAIKIFEGMKNEENFIRVLNLFKNNLTDKCIKTFSEMILLNRNLEEINFGNNSLTDEALELIAKNYGIFKLNNDELEEYKRLEKERQDIIKQNAKLKASKKPEMEVPVLDELKEINGEFFTVKNDCLKVFNLIQNHFTEKSFDNIIKLLDGNHSTVLTIEGRPYSEEQKAKLKDTESENKYGDRVFLLK
jgi:hypothetical protein